MSRKSYHHGDLRRTLIGATVEILATTDVDKLSLREVARRAEVSSGAPYHHFQDKLGLLAAVAMEGWAALNDAMSAAAHPDPETSLKQRSEAYIRYALAHPAHYRVLLLRDLKDDLRFPELTAEAGRGLEELVAVISAVRGGKADQDLLLVAISIWSTVHGFVSLWLDGPLQNKPIPLGVLIDRVSETVVQVARG